MANRSHENISIRKVTLDLIRMAALQLSVKRSQKVSQVQFIHEAVEEKIEREGLKVKQTA